MRKEPKTKTVFTCYREDLQRECAVIRYRYHYELAIWKTPRHEGDKPIYTGVTKVTCSRKAAILTALHIMVRSEEKLNLNTDERL